MADATIRRAVPADAQALAILKLATFRETFLDEGFAIPYPPDNLAAFETASYQPDVVAAELVDPSRATWIAADGDRLVGYAQIGPCKLPHPEVRPGHGELYQIYLRRGAQGGGLGRELLALAMVELERRFPGPIWLGVWSGNLKAQDFYARQGFANVGGYRFAVGEGWHDEEFIFRRD